MITKNREKFETFKLVGGNRVRENRVWMYEQNR